RIILTAATANQPAWEFSRHGHGLLTFHLLDALRGAPSVVHDGKISVYRLLEYVTQRVTDDAALIGKDQHPTLRGRIDGEFLWPVFKPGPLYLTAFPELPSTPAAADIRSLSAFGFPATLLDRWAQGIPMLNAMQLTAINDYGLLVGKNMVVVAPTSSGKTMIGELAALRGALSRRRAVFLLPLRALVNDKYRYFTDTYGPLGIRVARATGEVADDVPVLVRGQYDIGLLTYEKFTALVLAFPHILEGIDVVVVDEAQMITDANRGINLEFLLTLIRMKRRHGVEPQVIALSAVIGETRGFDRWLGGGLLRHAERPVPLREGILCADGRFHHLDAAGKEQWSEPLITRIYGKGSSQDWIIPLVRRLSGEGQQAIVFRETRGEAQGCAKYLAQALTEIGPATEALAALPDRDPSRASADLRACLAHGVAFHMSDLGADERRVVEEYFRRGGSIRVIAATTTLAMGINTPAESVVIAGLQHPGDVPYSVAEYKNMVGRAGRLGQATEGTSYIIAAGGLNEHYLWSHYVLGKPEDFRSHFEQPDSRATILRILAASERSATHALSADDVLTFLEASFGAYLRAQAGHADPAWSRAGLQDSLEGMVRHKLVENTDGDRYELTDLGRFSGQSGMEVESIVRLVDVFQGLSVDQITDPALLAAAQVTVELDAVHFPINRKSTEKEPRVWPAELHRQGVAPKVVLALRANVKDQHTSTLRAKKAMAALLFVSGQPLADTERVMVKFGGSTGGAAGAIRGAASRTRDVLPAVGAVIRSLGHDVDLERRIAKLAARLETGANGAAAELAMYVGTRLTRGDYLALAGASLGDMENLLKADDEALLAALNGDRTKRGIVRGALERYLEAKQDHASTPTLPLYTP
ncbi:MAG: DEAD/DEAH box helicase, partial [Candidatus Hydrogenedentales bacterium]